MSCSITIEHVSHCDTESDSDGSDCIQFEGGPGTKGRHAAATAESSGVGNSNVQENSTADLPGTMEKDSSYAVVDVEESSEKVEGLLSPASSTSPEKVEALSSTESSASSTMAATGTHTPHLAPALLSPTSSERPQNLTALFSPRSSMCNSMSSDERGSTKSSPSSASLDITRQTTDQVEARIMEFQSDRERQRTRIFTALARLGTTFAVLGTLANGIETVFSWQPFLHNGAFLSKTVMWAFTVMAFSMCSLDVDGRFTVDALFIENRCLRYTIPSIFAASAIFFGLGPISSSKVSFLGVFPLMRMYFIRSSSQVYPSTCCTLFFLNSILVNACIDLECFVHCELSECSKACIERSADDALLFMCTASLTFVALMLSTMHYTYSRRRFNRTGGEHGSNPSIAFWHTVHAYIAQVAVHQIVLGLFDVANGKLATGMLIVSASLPSLLILAMMAKIGLNAFFTIASRLFEDKQANQDSAFVAMLLDGLTVKQGNRWWVHKSHTHTDEDWSEGHVTHVDERHFTISLFVETSSGQQIIETIDECEQSPPVFGRINSTKSSASTISGATSRAVAAMFSRGRRDSRASSLNSSNGDRSITSMAHTRSQSSAASSQSLQVPAFSSEGAPPRQVSPSLSNTSRIAPARAQQLEDMFGGVRSGVRTVSARSEGADLGRGLRTFSAASGGSDLGRGLRTFSAASGGSHQHDVGPPRGATHSSEVDMQEVDRFDLQSSDGSLAATLARKKGTGMLYSSKGDGTHSCQTTSTSGSIMPTSSSIIPTSSSMDASMASMFSNFRARARALSTFGNSQQLGVVPSDTSSRRSQAAQQCELAPRLAGRSLRHIEVVLPLAGMKLSTTALFNLARENLRCIDWSNFSLELLSGTSEIGRVNGNSSLSRPLGKGEKIDFFLSHSWHDDPRKKWECLKIVADKFFADRGRYPTFWLDIVCIDQAAIADGLRVLPLNIMACSQLLALVGGTYTHRLWCVWELFTVVAFADESAAQSRVRLVPLHSDSGEPPMQALEAFQVDQAHCYDPNEEARLLGIINAVGSTTFERRIQNLSRACNSSAQRSFSRSVFNPTA